MSQNTAPQPAPASAPRGRGRGKRGQGRGRGVNVNVTVNTPSTLQQRAAQVASSSAAPLAPMPIQPMPLDQLSAIMDSFFPVESEPTDYFNEVVIDTHGALDIAQSTYRNVTRVEPKLEDTLSEAEFCLAYGYILAHRVLQVRASIAPIDIPGFVELNDHMRSLHDLPSPLSQYLDGLGLYRDPHGQTICPSLVLPRYDQNNVTTGLIPSDINTGYSGATNTALMSAMYPYGLLERNIVLQGNPGVLNGANFMLQIDPAAPNPPLDALIITSFTASMNRTYLPPNPRRLPRLAGLPAIPQNQTGILNSIRWSSELFQQFLSFLIRLQKHMPFSPYSRSTAGSPAMLVYATPLDGTAVIEPEAYDYHAFGALTRSEMHAARLFNYRVDRIAAPHTALPGAADAHATVDNAPNNLQEPGPLILTQLRGRRLYLTHYINHFLKG